MTLRTLTLTAVLTLAAACVGGSTGLDDPGDDRGTEDPADDTGEVDETTWEDLEAMLIRGDGTWEDEDASPFCDELERWYAEMTETYRRECARGARTEECIALQELMRRVAILLDRDCSDDPGR